jgi:hypothetical protein
MTVILGLILIYLGLNIRIVMKTETEDGLQGKG